MTVWFTSDTHFGHSRVIQYSRRPFKDVAEMDEMMITNWNRVVRPDDHVYHLGDFSFHRDINKTVSIANRLMGQKHLIFGNHDRGLRDNLQFLSCFASTNDLDMITVEGQRIVICHYAMLTWNQFHRGSWMLHGHSHGSLPDDPHSLRADVGVDPRGYTPISFDGVRRIMANKEFHPVDHHGKKDDE